jgi:hypothetical protein
MTRAAALLLIGALSLGACDAKTDEWAGYDAEASRWYDVQQIQQGDETWKFRPYERSDGNICIAYIGPTEAGGHCFVSHWQVEAEALPLKGASIVYGVARAGVSTEHIPLRAHQVAEISPQIPLGKDNLILELVLDGPPVTHSNEIAAYDEAGVKLGNEHWNVGTNGCDWAGPWDGTVDRTLSVAQTKPRCART